MSCKDTQNLCNQKHHYARTYNGWFGYYHYITFCPSFFLLDNMDQKIAEIGSELSGGKTEKASDMRYLRTTGQYFFHEMMHTRIADGGKEPHITDGEQAGLSAGWHLSRFPVFRGNSGTGFIQRIARIASCCRESSKDR